MKNAFRWLRGHGTARDFEREAKPFLPALYRTALRLTDQRADAEDLVHDTYVKAFESYQRTSFETPANLRAWLFRIMMNTYLDQYRRRMRSPEVSRAGWTGGQFDNIVEIVASPLPGPDAALDQKRFALALESAIAAMPTDVRAVVILFFVEELTYQQIAEVVGCPTGTVMSRLWRGRRALREQLAEFAGDTRPYADRNAKAGGAE